MSPLSKKRRMLGFSLVEVVLALGLASFALVSMVGLLSVGFRGARDSMNMTVISDIAQGISGEAQLTSWTNLSANYNSQTSKWYFDDMGARISTSNNAAFEAKTRLTNTPSVILTSSYATNLYIEIKALANPAYTNVVNRLLVKSE